jgi:hypothetical protein
VIEKSVKNYSLKNNLKKAGFEPEAFVVLTPLGKSFYEKTYLLEDFIPT